MLTSSEQKFLQEHKSLLQLPRWKFILIYGLSWAFLVLCLMTAYEYFFERERFTVQNLLVNLSVYPFAGILYGWIMHWFLTKKLKKLEKKQLNA
jgi:hypothetical protein